MLNCILSTLRKNSWGKKSQSYISECSGILITHVPSKKERKKHISESWQSAPCYFPKTLPKHFDVFFYTRAHTHTYQRPTETTQPATQARRSHRQSGVCDAGLARTRDVLQARPAGPPQAHGCWGRPCAQMLQAGPGQGKSRRLVTVHTHHTRQGPDLAAGVRTM